MVAFYFQPVFEGRTHHQELTRMAEGMNVPIEELDDIPEIIDYFKHVWEWFLALNHQRSTGFGLGPISYSELQAYLDLMQIDYLREDIEAFTVIDRAYLEVMKES